MGKYYQAISFFALVFSINTIAFAQDKSVQKVINEPQFKAVNSPQNFTVQKADSRAVINPNPQQNNIFFDYNSMPADVKSKVSSNKANGKPLLDGVLKGYTVEVESCKTETSAKQSLLFLNDIKGFYKTIFISSGKVKLMVSPEVSSVELKDKMLAAKLKFNFLEQFYLLK